MSRRKPQPGAKPCDGWTLPPGYRGVTRCIKPSCRKIGGLNYCADHNPDTDVEAVERESKIPPAWMP